MELTDIKILIADEDEKFRLTLKSIFLDRNIRVEEAKDGFETVKLIEDYRPDIILLALKLTGIGGIEILKKVQPLVSDSIVIIITAHGSIRTAIEATRLGIYDYIEKPIKPERILAMIDQALHAKALESENIRLKDALISEYKLIGKSEVVQNIVSFVNKAAISDANVLLTGNNGTGKDHLAQYIHLNSSRNQHQFVNVNFIGKMI